MTTPTDEKTPKPRVSPRRTLGTCETAGLVRKARVKVSAGMLIMAAVLFLSAGRLSWWMGWVYAVVNTVCAVLSTSSLIRKDPELVAERSRLGPGAKRWDVVLATFMGVYLPLATLVVAGLDERFAWRPAIPLAVQVAALALMVLGYLLVYRAMLANTFFSTVIRIQEDRGHHVVTAGPYRYVRHPGYVGAMAFNLSAPLVLGSAWALIPTSLTLLLIAVRTALEDRTLAAELEGYGDYAERVRYRLLPGVW